MPDPDQNRENAALTLRQQLLQLLRDGTWSCRDLSQELHQSEKVVLENLDQLRLSLRSRGLILQIDPAVCRHCGFVFADRTRLAKPGKCPACQKSGIEPPLYTVKEKS